MKRPSPYWLLAGLAALFLSLGAIAYFVTGPQRARTEAVQSNADANGALGTVQAAQQALQITVDTQALHGRIDVITKDATDAIRHAPGADAQVDPALHAAGLRALCMYPAYHGGSSCPAVLDADPEQPAG